MSDPTLFNASGRRLRRIRLTLIGGVVLAGTALVWATELPIWAAVLACGGLCFFIFTTLTTRGLQSGAPPIRAQQRDDVDYRSAVTLWRSALDHFPNPVLLLDQDGRIIESNGRTHLLISGARPGRHVSAVLRAPAVLEAISRILMTGAEESVDFLTPVPVEHEFRAHCIPVRVGTPSDPMGKAGPLIALVVLDDLTAARRVEQMRVDFIANASHELRTPLASLSGFIETLRGHAKDDPEAREKFLEIMYQQSVRMRYLIDDLLSLSRIELNEHVPPSDRVDLAAVVADVIDTLAPISQEAAVEIRFDHPDTLPRALGTREELTQVVQNLLDNALKYGRAGGHVDVRLSASPANSEPLLPGAHLLIEVQDYGEGIPRADIPRLTERFYRVDVARSREQGGTGLGLAIVKHIINRHRGALDIESQVGKGTTFKVMIPQA